ncbi:hypothetical protein DFQ14_102594 [Halopolyspora algeriensis]|uniref:Homeodomain-like domain-containing protein n=1 Tax=Halopolyspora algeriensis TaxID=1500506 RepID=A0A368W120_9ACTN|nr:hypothetical protein [Halopolyspora algeriensis]RCW46291.1 hypothetical protein DFQ14_102594 [Halopolyspora algeriensis]TQM55691.1 hypothetical protein FHU43_0467 [Halopolyspora algeriensis]
MTTDETDAQQPAAKVLQLIEALHTELAGIDDPVVRIESARRVRANAKKFETLYAEITRQAVRDMRERNMSYARIAEELGVSRARAYQLASKPAEPE